METKIRAAFDAVRAEEAAKEAAAAAVVSRLGRQRRGLRPVVAVAACMSLCLVGLWLCLTPVAAISIEGESAVELSVNRLNRVVSVRGCDAGGEQLARRLRLGFAGYETAVETVLAQKDMAEATVCVTAPDAGRCAAMGRALEHCAGERVDCADQQEAALAREAGLPLGKYRLWQQLLDRGSALTAQEAAELTVPQLRALLTGTDTAGSGNGNGSGNGHGHHGGQKE